MPLIEKFGHVFYFFFSFVKDWFNFLLADNWNPVYFFDFEDSRGPNFATWDSFLGDDQERNLL